MDVAQGARYSNLVVAAAALVCGEALAWGMAVRSGPSHIVAKLQAWADVIALFPEVPTARRQIKRVVGGRELLQLHGADVNLAQLDRGRLTTLALPAVNACFGGTRALVARLAS